MSNRKEATEWFENLPSIDYRNLGIRRTKLSLAKIYYPGKSYKDLTGEQIEKIWMEETSGYIRGEEDKSKEALKLKYDGTNLFEIKLRIQPDVKVTTEVIIEALDDLHSLIVKKGWRVRTSSGKEIEDRHVKMNIELDGVKYRIPCGCKYSKNNNLHVFVYDNIKALGTSKISKDDALEKLQEDIDFWVKVHTERGTIKEQIFEKVINEDVIHLFKVDSTI
jgi:hypothetical protein